MLGAPMSRRSLAAAAAVAAALFTPRPAQAIPVFAHRYDLSCQACHTVVPHLTALGEQFLGLGYRLPGLSASFGDEGRGLSASLAAVRGHEPGSGLPAHGIDRELYVQHASSHVVFSAYRYDGTRRIDDAGDRFWRAGYGVTVAGARTRFDAAYQHGFDTHANADGALRSSGGFAQLRYELTPRAFAIVR